MTQYHFKAIFHKGSRRNQDFNWEALQFDSCDLSRFRDNFSEVEVLAAINQMPVDKTPGLDDFKCDFFKSCSDIIKVNRMNAINSFSNLHITYRHWLNSSNIVLLPKEVAEDIVDF